MSWFHEAEKVLERVHLWVWVAGTIGGFLGAITGNVLNWGFLQTVLICCAGFIVGTLVFLAYMRWWESDPARAVASSYGRVRLADAANAAYHELETRAIGIAARSSRQGPLAYMARTIFYEVPQVWGIRHPSTQLTPVHEVAGHAFDFSDDGGSLQERGNIIVSDLTISKLDFAAALHQLRLKADSERY